MSNGDEIDGRLIVSLREIASVATGLLSICERASNLPKRILVLDFAEMEFMSSATIGQLVILRQYAKRLSLDIRVRNVSTSIWQIFLITKLNKVFKLDDDN